MTKNNVKQYISLEDPTSKSHEYFLCLCGNTVTSDGFITCLSDGLIVEPLVNGPWVNLNLCFRCLGVINQDTLEIIYPKGVKKLNKKFFETGDYQPYAPKNTVAKKTVAKKAVAKKTVAKK